MKTLTYSAVHFVVAVTVTYALTRSVAAALSVGLIEPLVQTVAYHLHERAWAKVRCRAGSGEGLPGDTVPAPHPATLAQA
jgi:uncharacterized membrane protein